MSETVSVENDPVLVSNQPDIDTNIPDAGNFPVETANTPDGPARENKTPPDWKAFPIRGYIIAIAVSILLLYALNNLQNIYVPWIPSDFSRFFWNILNNVYNRVEISFLSPAYMQCLWAINISLSASIMGHFTLLIYRPRWFHYLIQAMIFGLGLLAAYVIYAIYPFSLESVRIDRLVRGILILGMVSLAVWFTISVVRSILAFLREKRNRRQIEITRLRYRAGTGACHDS